MRVLTSPSFGRSERTTFKFDHTVKRFCGRCNNGWMSGIEGRAAPVLTRLIRGNGATVPLTANDRRILATWAYKTALVVDGGLPASTPLPKIPADMYKGFFVNKVPRPFGLWMWIGAYQGSRAAQWDREGFAITRTKPKAHAPDALSHYSITTLNAYGVLFQVLSQLGGSVFPTLLPNELLARYFVQIWPPDDLGTTDWPPGGFALSTEQVKQLASRRTFEFANPLQVTPPIRPGPSTVKG